MSKAEPSVGVTDGLVGAVFPRVVWIVPDQLRVDPDCYGLYASRDTTRREHFAALCLHLGYIELSLLYSMYKVM